MMRACIVTCEHGGNRLPARYRALFNGQWKRLHGHEGYDKGALRLAREMAAALDGDLHCSVISRLLVDLNRSVDHPANMSTAVAMLDEVTRQQILDEYYHPYRATVERAVGDAIGRGKSVLHLSCHSFAEQIDGQARDAAIGLLYDPVRHSESVLCLHWEQALAERMPELGVRLNYPYLGVDDGLVTSLRGRYPNPLYAGIELEVRRDMVTHREIREVLWETLRAAMSRPARLPA